GLRDTEPGDARQQLPKGPLLHVIEMALRSGEKEEATVARTAEPPHLAQVPTNMVGHESPLVEARYFRFEHDAPNPPWQRLDVGLDRPMGAQIEPVAQTIDQSPVADQFGQGRTARDWIALRQRKGGGSHVGGSSPPLFVAG